MAPGHPGDDAQMARRLPLRRAKGRPTAERAVPAGRARRLGRGRADIFEEALLGDTEVVDNRRNPDCGHSAVTEDHMHALRRGALFPCEDVCIDAHLDPAIGSAWCRERVCPYVLFSVVYATLKN